MQPGKNSEDKQLKWRLKTQKHTLFGFFDWKVHTGDSGLLRFHSKDFRSKCFPGMLKAEVVVFKVLRGEKRGVLELS